MGSGNKFHGGLPTKGGLIGKGEALPTPRSLAKDPLVKDLLNKGVKINLKETLFVIKDKTGMVVWLEKGSTKGGLLHILDGNGKSPGHAGDFKNALGLSRGEIPTYIRTVVSNGKLVSSKTVVVGNGRIGYERIYYHGGKYHLVTGIGTNGYIVSAYPVKFKK